MDLDRLEKEHAALMKFKPMLDEAFEKYEERRASEEKREGERAAKKASADAKAGEQPPKNPAPEPNPSTPTAVAMGAAQSTQNPTK